VKRVNLTLTELLTAEANHVFEVDEGTGYVYGYVLTIRSDSRLLLIYSDDVDIGKLESIAKYDAANAT
jgi:hypothetical protein